MFILKYCYFRLKGSLAAYADVIAFCENTVVTDMIDATVTINNMLKIFGLFILQKEEHTNIYVI